jgi:hypothetical protein
LLKWRRDPDYGLRKRLSEHRKMQHEWRMKQIENDILQVRRENEQIRQENAKCRQLLASIDALCFQPETSLIPPNPTEPSSGPPRPDLRGDAPGARLSRLMPFPHPVDCADQGSHTNVVQGEPLTSFTINDLNHIVSKPDWQRNTGR